MDAFVGLGGDKTRMSAGGNCSPYGSVMAAKQDGIATMVQAIKNNGMHTIASDVAKQNKPTFPM